MFISKKRHIKAINATKAAMRQEHLISDIHADVWMVEDEVAKLAKRVSELEARVFHTPPTPHHHDGEVCPPF